MFLSLSCLYLSLIFFCRSVRCFPKDLEPKLILQSKDTNKLPAFTGEDINGEKEEILDVQEIKIIDGKILIGSRNAVYVLSKSSFVQQTGSIAYDQILNWKPTEEVKSLCIQKTSPSRCYNHIRVITSISNDQILLCGTNAWEPKCQVYSWSGTQFGGLLNISVKSDKYLSPYDDLTSLAYTYTDKHMYIGTRFDGFRKEAMLRIGVRIDSNNTQSNLPNLKTDYHKDDWLKNPRFIGTVDTGDRILIFFSEEAVESFEDKVVFSRVSQVCKNDTGPGEKARSFKDKWTSFFKARLNCSVPGNNSPFYFNNLQHITQPVLLGGKETIFATFTTPDNSISGSAVCAFTLESIKDAFNGNFKGPSPDSSCRDQLVIPPPTPTLTSCGTHKGQNLLEFIWSYRLMSEGVRAVTPSPLFTYTKSNEKLSAIAVETNVEKLPIAALYIGTDEGKLLKIIVSDNLETAGQVVFSEKWDVYNQDLCFRDPSTVEQSAEKDLTEQKRVLNIVLLKDFILVAFKHCVISVPKKSCWHYKYKRSCAQSGNPYCGWKSGYCRPIPPEDRSSYEQDLFEKNIYEETVTTTAAASNSQNEIVFPLVLALIGALALALAVVLFLTHYKKKSVFLCFKKSSHQHNGQDAGAKDVQKSRRTSEKLLQVTIEGTTPIEPPPSSPQYSLNANMNCNYETKNGCKKQNNLMPYHHLATKLIKNVKTLDETNSTYSSSSSYLTNNSCHSSFDGRGSTFPRHNDVGWSQPIKSRILASPNYLPVTPCTPRISDSTSDPHSMRTFFSQGTPLNDESKLDLKFPENLDPPFPPPPPSALVTEEGGSFTELPESNRTGGLEDFVDGERRGTFSSISYKSQTPEADLEGSISSGFISSSPQEKEQVLAANSRKALIAAKGILSAQSYLASPKTKQKRKIKKKEDTFSRAILNHFPTSSDASLEFHGDRSQISFPSPEYLCDSEEEEKEKHEMKMIAPAPVLTSLVQKKEKRSLKFFGSKKDKVREGFQDEDFRASVLADDFILPKVEGWQEIEFLEDPISLGDSVSSYDDTFTESQNKNTSGQFLTLRPKNRMRQKMPKLRNTCKQWTANNNPLPVPTPEIPDR